MADVAGRALAEAGPADPADVGAAQTGPRGGGPDTWRIVGPAEADDDDDGPTARLRVAARMAERALAFVHDAGLLVPDIGAHARLPADEREHRDAAAENMANIVADALEALRVALDPACPDAEEA